MAIVVTPDIVHPSAFLKVDYTQFASLNIFNIPVFTAARVFGVTGLQDGSSQQSATILARSLQQYGIPPLQDPYPSAGVNAVSLGYQVQPQSPNSDQDVFIVVNYSTIVLNPIPNNGQYTISDDTTISNSTTQVDPKTRHPLTFAFSDAGGIQDDTATISFDQVSRRVTALAAISGTKIEACRAAVGKVNNPAWNGLGIGYWLLESLSQQGATTSTVNPATTYVVSLTASTRTTIDWSSTSVFRDRNSGRYKTVSNTIADTAKTLPYTYGVIYGGPGPDYGNGLLRVGPYDTVDFSTIFPF